MVIAVVVALLIVFAIVESYSGGGSSSLPTLATASTRSFPIVVTATGTVVRASEVDLNFSAPGTLVAINVTVGQMVTKGMVLAQVDPSVAQANLAAANVELSDSVTGPQVAAAQGDIYKAKAELAATNLTAPANGTVVAINGQVGETVSNAATARGTLPGTGAPVPDTSSSAAIPTVTSMPPLIALSTSNGVVIGAAFNAGDAPQLAAGQKGQVTSEVVSGLTLPCHVLAVDASATLIDGLPQYWTTIIPDGSSSQVLVGMPVNVSITVGEANNVVAVPNEAIYVLDGQAHVDVWFKGHSVATAVTPGAVGTALTQIKSGLTDGQQVVLSAPDGLPPSASSVPTPGPFLPSS